MKSRFFLNFKSLWIMVFTMFLLANLSLAQNVSLRIHQLDNYLSEEEIGPEDRLAKMIGEQLPTIVFSGGQEFFPTGQLPQVIHLNASDFGKINSGDSRFRPVKMINIYISSNAEKSSVRLSDSLLNTFINLEYVYINASVGLSEAEVASMVSGLAGTELVVLFKSAIPQ